MAYRVNVVPALSSSETGLEYFLQQTVGSGTIAHIIERGSRLVVVWDDA